MTMISARDKILDVAQHLAQTKGYNAFSYRDLAAEVGIKTSSIHYHFPKKEDLATALMERHRAVFAKLLKNIDATGADPVTKLRKYVGLFIGTLNDCNKICLGGMFASEILTFSDVTRQQVQHYFAQNESWLEGLIKEGIKKGVFAVETRPAKIARDIFAALEGAMLISRTFDDKRRLKQLGAWLESLLVAKE